MLAMSMAIDNLAITGEVGKSTNTISLILSCLSAEFSHRQQPHQELTILIYLEHILLAFESMALSYGIDSPYHPPHVGGCLAILAIMVSHPTPFNNSYVVFDMYSNVYISHGSVAHSG
jgi:hypothetical protein